MLKLVVFLAGLVAGSAGAVSWLLSSNASSPVAAPPAAGGATPILPPSGASTTLVGSLQARLEEVKARFLEARAEGERAGSETEQRLRRELDAYRKNPSHPEAS